MEEDLYKFPYLEDHVFKPKRPSLLMKMWLWTLSHIIDGFIQTTAIEVAKKASRKFFNVIRGRK